MDIFSYLNHTICELYMLWCEAILNVVNPKYRIRNLLVLSFLILQPSPCSCMNSESVKLSFKAVTMSDLIVIFLQLPISDNFVFEIVKES